MSDRITSLEKFLELAEVEGTQLNVEDYKVRHCQLSAYTHTKTALKDWEKYGSNVDNKFVVQMATGTGKSGVICILAASLANYKNILILTHSVGIRAQLKKSLGKFGRKDSFWTKVELEPEDYELVEAKGKEIPRRLKKNHRNIVLASIQSLTKQAKNLRKNLFDLIIFDEGHKKGAEKWEQVVEGMNCPIILMTATPFRSDGKELKEKSIFRFTFNDALNSEKPILKRVTFKGQEKDVVDQLVKELEYYRANYDLLKSKPKVIFRASSYESLLLYLEKFKSHNVVKREKLKVVAVHSSCNENKYPLFTNKNMIGDYDIIIHQDKLIEGYDDPSLCILGFEKRIDDGRVLIQLIGRVVRHDYSQGSTMQSALVICPNKADHEESWKLYIDFEKDPASYQFKKFKFVPKAGSLSLNMVKDILVRPSVLVKKHRKHITKTFANKIHEDILYWFQNRSREETTLVDKFEFVKEKKGILYAIYLFQKESKANFLKKAGLMNQKWHLLIIGFKGKYVFINSTDSSLPKTLREIPECSLSEFNQLLPTNSHNVLNVRLDNVVQGKHTLKSKSLTSTKTENHVHLAKDSTFNAKTITWSKGLDDKKSATVSTRRYTEHTRVSLDHLLGLYVKLHSRLVKNVPAKKHSIFNDLVMDVRRAKGTPFMLSSSFEEVREFRVAGSNKKYFSSLLEVGLKRSKGKISLHGCDIGPSINIKVTKVGGGYTLEYTGQKALEVLVDGDWYNVSFR